MDFEQGEVGKPPPGWTGSSIVTLRGGAEGAGRSLLLRNDARYPKGFARTLPAAAYRGEYIRLRAAVKTSALAGAALWLRIDGAPGEVLVFDNMADRPVRSPDWKWVEIRAVVPPEAARIVLGGLVYGQGTAGFSGASLDVLPAAVDPITPQAKAYLDHVLDLLQARHIDKRTADWSTIRAHAEARAAHARTPADTYPAIRLAIAELGEMHTLLLPPHTDMQAMATGPSPVPLSIRKVGRHVVELRLPGTGDPIGTEYIRMLRAAVAQQQAAGACGWVVDLRDDTGGNVWPMLRGLQALLGPPPWGGFKDADGRLQVWALYDGAAAAVDVPAWPVAPSPHKAALQPLAVLLGPRTTSAGEMTAIALAGRTDARSFGGATAGYTTGNGLVALPDGAALAMTTSRELDRTGAVVNGAVRPDQLTAPNGAEPAALSWLGGMGCR